MKNCHTCEYQGAPESFWRCDSDPCAYEPVLTVFPSHAAQLGSDPVERRESLTANDRQVGGTHYKDMTIQPWDVVDTWPLEQRIGYYRGGALKYLLRMGAKDERAQEIRKAEHYCKKLAETLETEK